jgi:hypothetical protein
MGGPTPSRDPGSSSSWWTAEPPSRTRTISMFPSDIARAASRGIGEGADAELPGSDDRRAAPCKENVVSKNRRVADPPVNSAAGCGVPTPGRRGKQPIRGGIDASQDSRDCRGRVRPRARSRSRSVRAGLTKHRAAQSVVSGAGQRPWVQLSRVRPRRDLLRGRRAQRGELEQHRSGVAVRRRLHENALITATMGRSSPAPRRSRSDHQFSGLLHVVDGHPESRLPPFHPSCTCVAAAV